MPVVQHPYPQILTRAPQAGSQIHSRQILPNYSTRSLPRARRYPRRRIPKGANGSMPIWSPTRMGIWKPLWLPSPFQGNSVLQRPQSPPKWTETFESPHTHLCMSSSSHLPPCIPRTGVVAVLGWALLCLSALGRSSHCFRGRAASPSAPLEGVTRSTDPQRGPLQNKKPYTIHG